jgi:hypothetical protein
MGETSTTPRGLTGYELRVASSNASVELTDLNLTDTVFSATALQPSVTKHVLSGLQKGSRYYFQVIALNSARAGVGTEYLRD